jgi:hypothetical protein
VSNGVGGGIAQIRKAVAKISSLVMATVFLVGGQYEAPPATLSREHIKQSTKELWTYLIFLSFFIVLNARSLFHSEYYYFEEAVAGQIAGVEMQEVHSPTFDKTFVEVATAQEFYHFLFGPFVHTIFTADTFDGHWDSYKKNPDGRPTGQMLGYGRLLGGVRIGQIRAKSRDCEVPPELHGESFSYNCYGKSYLGFQMLNSVFDVAEEDPSDFGSYRGTQFRREGLELNRSSPVPNPLVAGTVARQRSKWMSSHTTRKWNTYPSSTHTLVFDPMMGRENATAFLEELLESQYIDMQTRAVTVDFTVYNAHLDCVCQVIMTAEFLETGGVYTDAELKVARLWNHHTPKDNVYDFLLGVVCLFYAYYTRQEIKEIRYFGWAYWGSALNWLQVLNIAFFTASVVCQATAVLVMPEHVDIDDSVTFMDFGPAVTFREFGAAIRAVNVCLNWFTLARILSFVPHFGLMTNTLSKASSGVLSFGAVFFVIFTGFSMAFAIVFGSRLEGFRTFGATNLSERAPT